MTRLLIILFAIAAAVSACSGSGDSADGSAPVPRRKAYPRLNLPPREYSPVQGIDWNIEANSAAVASLGRGDNNDWITLSYPSLGDVSVMLTVIPASESQIPPVLDNRAERINLNLGANPGQVWQVEDSLLSGEIIVSNSITTPVQLLVTDNKSVVLTGAAFIPSLTPASRDSLAPVVEYLTDDIIHLVSRFRHIAPGHNP